MRKLFAGDVIFLGYLAIISALVVAFNPPGGWIYLSYHVLALGMMAMAVYAYGRFGGRFWTLVRYWYILPLSYAGFRELHYLIPQIHPFDDHRFDRMLAAFDRRWFGDVDRFFLSHAPPLWIDFLHLCYWFYFAGMLVLGVVLFRRREYDRAREYLAVLLTGLYLSFLGYILVPAIGPHHFFPARPAALDGGILGGPFHQAMLNIEWRMPDAFPSGHTLLTLIVLVMAWRHHRRTFWTLLIPSLGCIWATMALRYHYVVDVLASFAILPAVILIGIGLHRWKEAKR